MHDAKIWDTRYSLRYSLRLSPSAAGVIAYRFYMVDSAPHETHHWHGQVYGQPSITSAYQNA